MTKNNLFSTRLTREVEVRRYPVLADITFEQKRPDVQSLLHRFQGSPKSFPERLKNYLVDLKLWNDGITRLGKEFLKNGTLPCQERGLYNIWYTHKDEILGTRPIAIQRDSAYKDPKVKEYLEGVKAKRSSFLVNEQQSICTLEYSYNTEKNEERVLLTLVPNVVCQYDCQRRLKLELLLDDSTSVVKLNGNIEFLDYSKSKGVTRTIPMQLEFPFDTEKNEVYDQVLQFGTWNKQYKRTQISIEDTNHEVLHHFRKNKWTDTNISTKDYGKFDSVHAENIPVMPLKNEAMKWQKKWILERYRSDYQSMKTVQQKLSSWLADEAMKEASLSMLSVEEMLMISDLSSHRTTMWNIATPYDLRPLVPSLRQSHFTLRKDKHMDITKFFHQLSSGATIRHIVYSDRYALDAIKDLEMLTRDYASIGIDVFSLVSKSEEEYPYKWNIHTMERNTENHDRYWILSSVDKDFYWKQSGSINYLTTDSRSITPQGNITFTPIQKTELPQYLQKHVSEISRGASV